MLLFRLFAMQMAEKYHMDKVVLDDEAKQLLTRYKWPGNIRQLKSITEQLSILSAERTITADILSRFIPQDPESTQLATIRNDSDHSFENEREILYKILFELRSNVNDMRREMSTLKKQIADVQIAGSSDRQPSPISATSLAPLAPYSTAPQTAAPLPAEDAVAEEYVEPEQDILNLNQLSRQMIVKALERNGGNRRRAASELGISDRTLYRKLKQYGMEK